jgi:very-short-patch-repair endonuclease
MRRVILAIAGIGVIITLLDIFNVLPGVASKLTPALFGFVIVYMVYSNWHQSRLMRGIRRKAEGTPQKPSTTRQKPNKKRQQNPKPEYRSIAWHGLTLRSHSEVKIAKSLDNKGLMFLADPKIRLHTENHRQTREVDFLIQHQGKWGILEVDGPQHEHSVEADKWRDARFGEQGLLVVRVPADQCYREPDAVVEMFLYKLAAHSGGDSKE